MSKFFVYGSVAGTQGCRKVHDIYQLATDSGSGSLGTGSPLMGSAVSRPRRLLFRTSKDRGDPGTVHWGHKTGKMRRESTEFFSPCNSLTVHSC